MEKQDANARVIFRIMYILKRLTDKWVSNNLSKVSSSDFNVTHLPYFMNIGENGISNHDLVQLIKVTKQGVSKIIKELESLGLTYTVKSETDARSIMIYLTDQGKSLFGLLKEETYQLHDEYKKVVGVKNFETTIDTLLKLIDLHEQKEIDSASEGN
ncbi:MarR family winged helix-turn-helix transcriptional regulator [Pedobacter antarcticus]|uniref:MarR family winged helix-turn-helix transcriptional regulator n=1 Tax=Pedobacter antarcticus TaxID=34086 RepID=UPI0008878CFC|nr:MarR family transcriptional regulator [Pedobacter antarcticus]SDM59657.1 DNA-binding transcriptional regulator, MarR family [Pedobacter antarcticus]